MATHLGAPRELYHTQVAAHAKGMRTLNLPDGSSVYVNANTRVRGEIHAHAGVGIYIHAAAIGQVERAHAFGVGCDLGVIQLTGRAEVGGHHRAQQRGRHGQGWAPHRRFAFGQCRGLVQLLQLGQV
jgi:ATP:corrinoid adenosyltransferase